MRTLKAFGVAGGLVAAALVGGTLISVVSASPGASKDATSATLADDVDATAYCDLWRQTFADELGVSVDALTPAAKAAAIATIDQAIADGNLSEDVGARMKEQIDNADLDGCRLLGAGFHAWGRHAARVDMAHDWVGAAATALNMEESELVADIRDGQSLQEIADAQGVAYGTVTQAILDAAEEDLAALVDAGTITQDRADQVMANLTERLNTDPFPPAGRHGGPGHFQGGMPSFQGGMPRSLGNGFGFFGS
jgi:hypothetical protein